MVFLKIGLFPLMDLSVKYLLLATLIFLIIACGGGNSDHSKDNDELHLLEEDLTGTWVYTTKSEVYLSGSGQYLHTSYSKSVYLMEDTAEGTKYNSCEGIILWENYGVKTASGFSAPYESELFGMKDLNTLYRKYEETSPDFPDIYSMRTDTLKRVSSDLVVDWGDLVVLGDNIHIEATSHVCSFHSYRVPETQPKFLNIYVPVSDSVLMFTMTYWGTLSTGTYEFQQGDYSNQIINVSLQSGSIEFLNSYPEGVFTPNFATLDITVLESGALEGRLELYGPNGDNITGSFKLSPY